MTGHTSLTLTKGQSEWSFTDQEPPPPQVRSSLALFAVWAAQASATDRVEHTSETQRWSLELTHFDGDIAYFMLSWQTQARDDTDGETVTGSETQRMERKGKE